MTDRDPYALLVYDEFMREFIDVEGDQTPATFRSLDSAHWGALVLSEQLREEWEDLGGQDEEAMMPYKIYLVGPDGSRTPDSAL